MSTMMPGKLYDRSVLWDLLKTFTGAIFLAQIILLGLQAIRLSGLIIGQELTAYELWELMGGLAMSFMPIVLPIASLFAFLLVFGRMSGDREFVALQSMGLGPSRLLVPGLVVGVLLSGLSLWMALFVGPWGNRAFEKAIGTAFKKKIAGNLRAGTFSEGFLNMVLFVDEVDSASGELRRIFIFDEQNFDRKVSISASKGRWVQSDTDASGELKLIDGVLILTNSTSNEIQRIRFGEYSYFADFNSGQGSARDTPPSQSWTQLQELRETAKDKRPVWVEMARRVAISFACLFFVPLAFGLSLDNSRMAKSQAVFWGLVVLVSYWVAYFSLVSFVAGAQLRVVRTSEAFSWGVVWLPNLVVLIVGFWILRSKSALRS